MRITYLPAIDENRASSRYRQIMPGQQLEELGHTVYYNGGRKNSDWVIVNKALGDEYQQALWTGYNKICFDMCDNHFITKYEPNHLHMCELAHKITCSTFAMRDAIYKATGRIAEVISDPYELDIIFPENVNELKTLFWHGNSSSVPPLLDTGEITPGGDTGIIIKIDGSEYDFLAVGADNYQWSMNYSREHTIRALHESDACIIPAFDDDWAKCKSPNRLMNAVAQGKFVIANEIPSYRPFSDWMYIGDISEGIKWTKENLQDLPRRIISAQDYLSKNHTPQVIGKKWETVLSN